jgi:beta-glucanase (GH16 family)
LLHSGYRLAREWDFRRGIRTLEALRREFHTRYVWNQGQLDFVNDEWQRYRDNDNHVFRPEGLALVARAPRGLSPGAIESGMLRSRWSGRHGVFEIEMKVPRGRGLWPAFWLVADNGQWPPEIDVVEVVDNGRDDTRRSFHHLHGKAAQAGGGTRHSLLDTYGAYHPGIDFADALHTFAVEWTAERVRHLVDGRLVCERDYAWVHDDGRDAGPAHLLVNLAVGGRWPGPPAPGVLPAELLVAALRVWQR